MVEFAIEDTGVGMTNTFCAHDLVRPFSKRDGFSQGIGLGFTISSALAARIGGHIDVKSKLRIGTIVTITLPLLFIPTTTAASPASLPYCSSRVWFDCFTGRALKRAQSFIFHRLHTAGMQKASHTKKKRDCGSFPRLPLKRSFRFRLVQQVRRRCVSHCSFPVLQRRQTSLSMSDPFKFQ